VTASADSPIAADDAAAPAAASTAPGRGRRIDSVRRVGGLFLAILAVGTVFTILNGSFLTTTNLLELLRSMSSLAIIALGLTLVIIIGELDLSIGAVYGLAAMVCGLLWTSGAPIWLALLAGLGSGAGVGAVNAFFTTVAGIPSFIVTLGALNLVQGTTLLISNAQAVNPEFDPKQKVPGGELDAFKSLAGADLPLDIPVQVVWLIVVAAVMAMLLHRSLFGFRLLAMGGNPDAARLARLPLRRYKCVVFIICGFLSLTFPVFAAVVIGGASLTGGQGTVIGTLSGALLLTLLSNGLNLLGVGAYAQLMFVGAVTIAAVGIDRLSTRPARDP
jgi:ribose/xylose/arabinose/galactoside ABC-type transport system permease subunit